MEYISGFLKDLNLNIDCEYLNRFVKYINEHIKLFFNYCISNSLLNIFTYIMSINTSLKANILPCKKDIPSLNNNPTGTGPSNTNSGLPNSVGNSPNHHGGSPNPGGGSPNPGGGNTNLPLHPQDDRDRNLSKSTSNNQFTSTQNNNRGQINTEINRENVRNTSIEHRSVNKRKYQDLS